VSPLAQALLATFLVSSVTLVGIVVLVTEWTERLEVALLSFAAGVLLATTFLELLPNAVSGGVGDANIFIATLGSVVLFFLLERFLSSWHVHADGHTRHAAYLVLVGDSVHNFIDGVVIAAGFLVGPHIGVATTLAVAAHEIPHEIADYSVLISARFSRTGALGLNFLSGLTALLGAVMCFAFEEFVQSHLPWFMAAAAGMFIYIAAAGLIPELHHPRWQRSWLSTLPLLIGIALIALLTRWIPDSY
jgi:zinc and cadmium transporter